VEIMRCYIIFHDNLFLENHHRNYGWFYNFLVLLQLIKGVSFYKERMGDQKKENIQKRKKEK
jgi:hypothetical protein